MRIVKINGKEQMMKSNVGIIKRAAKALKIKTPELFYGLNIGDIEVGAMLLFHSINYNDKQFEMETIDEMRMEEFNELIDKLTEEVTGTLPDATGGDTSGKK